MTDDYARTSRTIYQGMIGVGVRLDTGIDLSTATLLEIRVKKPSNTFVTWPATVYTYLDGSGNTVTTQSITYTTVEGDLDELGEYILQAYVERPSEELLGDAIAVTVLPSYSTDDIDSIEGLFKVLYWGITLQTDDEASESPAANDDANISAEEFGIYLGLAQDELERLVGAKHVPTDYITTNQSNMLLCHLVADYYEMGNPDWNFKSESMGSGVSITRGVDTGPRAAINKLLDTLYESWLYTARSGIRMGEKDLVMMKDHKHYPRRFKKTQIPAFDFADDGFDSNETTESGFYGGYGNYNDRNY